MCFKFYICKESLLLCSSRVVWSNKNTNYNRKPNSKVSNQHNPTPNSYNVDAQFGISNIHDKKGEWIFGK